MDGLVPWTIEREHRLVFGDGFGVSALSAQHLAFGVMRKRAAGRCRQGLSGEPFRTGDVGCGRVGHIIEDAGRKRVRQIAPRRIADRAPRHARTD